MGFPHLLVIKLKNKMKSLLVKCLFIKVYLIFFNLICNK